MINSSLKHQQLHRESKQFATIPKKVWEKEGYQQTPVFLIEAESK